MIYDFRLTIDDFSWLFVPFVLKTYLKKQTQSGVSIRVHSWLKPSQKVTKMHKRAQKFTKTSKNRAQIRILSEEFWVHRYGSWFDAVK